MQQVIHQQPLSLAVTPRKGYMKKNNRMVDIKNNLTVKFSLGLFKCKHVNYKGTSLTYLVKYWSKIRKTYSKNTQGSFSMSRCLIYWKSLWHKDAQRVNFRHSTRDWYWFTLLFLADKKLRCILKSHSYQASLHLERLHLHSLNGFIQEFFLFILRRLLCCWLEEKRNQTKLN